MKFNIGDRIINDKGEDVGTIVDIKTNCYHLQVDNGVKFSIDVVHADNVYRHRLPDYTIRYNFIDPAPKKNECICQSLLNGHSFECPYPRNSL